MEEIIKTLWDWKKKGKGYPTQIQIHLTNYCNLKCFFCPTRALVKELNREKELRVGEWLRTVEEGNEMGVKEWHICGGGEPLFFTQDAIRVMKAIKESGKYGEIITNGTFFSDEVAREIVEMGWDKIYISLDSPFPDTQDLLRGKGCFMKIVEGVKNLNEWKKKLRTQKPSIHFHCVVCNLNYHQIPQLIELASRLGVDGVSLNALNIWKPEIAKLALNEREKAELLRILQACIREAEDLNVSNNIRDFLNFLFVEKANVMNEAMVEEVEKPNFPFSIACYYPWYNISIFADGRALPCFILKDEGENVRQKSLKEIWFGDYFNSIRERFLRNELKEDCAKCNPWNLPKMKEIRERIRSP